MERFDVPSEESIVDGRVTDAYFERTEEALQELGKNPEVVAEITADQFSDGEFEVFAGVKDVANLFDEIDVDVSVDALPEGTLFDNGPVMRIKGNYLDFARYETAILGMLSHASGMATAAHRCRRAAPETPILSFGSRHIHPSLAITLERSALIGGLDGFSNVEAGNRLGRDASGTTPHALMLAAGRENQEDVWKAFNKAAPEDTPRIILADTFTDEVDEVKKAVKTLGDDLSGVRLDTTGSRRGDFKHIIKEVQWALDEMNRSDVDVFVSGGLGPDDLEELKDVVDGFGVGGYVSNADPVDFSLDIVEIDGEETSKRGKLSGKKYVYRTDDGEHVVTRAESVQNVDLLQPIYCDGDIVREFSIESAAETLERDWEMLSED